MAASKALAIGGGLGAGLGNLEGLLARKHLSTLSGAVVGANLPSLGRVYRSVGATLKALLVHYVGTSATTSAGSFIGLL